MNIESLLDLKNLDDNPILKSLLINYISQMYESGLEITDEEIIQELRLLIKTNKLADIFITEFQANNASSIAS